MRNRTIISIKKSVNKTKTDRLQDKIIYFDKKRNLRFNSRIKLFLAKSRKSTVFIPRKVVLIAATYSHKGFLALLKEIVFFNGNFLSLLFETLSQPNLHIPTILLPRARIIVPFVNISF